MAGSGEIILAHGIWNFMLHSKSFVPTQIGVYGPTLTGKTTLDRQLTTHGEVKEIDLKNRTHHKKSWLGRYKLPNPTKKRISSEGLTKTVVSRDIGGHQEYYSTWLRDMINRNVSTVVVVIDHRHLLDDNNLDNQTALGYLVESLATKRRPKGLSFRGWLRARKYAPQRLILVANKADEWLSDDTFPMWEKGLIARHPIFDVFRNHLFRLQARLIPVYIDAMSARYAWNVQDSIIKGMKI